MSFNPKIKFANSKGIDLPIMYCYLAGYMSGEKLKETTDWRINIRKHYRNWESKKATCKYCYGQGKEKSDTSLKLNVCPICKGKGVTVIETVSYPIAFLDPYNGKEFATIDKEGLKSHIPANAIIHGDYMSVQKADIVVANMNTFGGSRPMTGTLWELAWTWQMKKPFILITDDKNYIHHPFTGQASWIVSSVEELLNEKILETFYRRLAGAVY